MHFSQTLLFYFSYDIKDSPKEGSTSSILTIRSVEIGDEGFYSCLAENSAGKDERSIKVTIIGESLRLAFMWLLM